MGFQMRPSRVLRKLRAGEDAIVIKMNLSDARAYELAAAYGFDAVWTCMEHTTNDWRDIEQQVRAAKNFDVDVMCRVQRGSYSDYIHPLELDAAGIMVPHIMSEADARAVVRMTRFGPVGRRPVDGGNQDGFYCNVPFEEYLEQANRERFVALQIEDPEALDELDAIAAVEGYDILFFGPGDFSHAVGAPGNMDDPRVVDARKRVAEAALKHGKFAGTTGSAATIPDRKKLGYTFLPVGADVVGLGRYFSGLAVECGLNPGNHVPLSR